MKKHTGYMVVLMTAKDAEEAQSIVRALLQDKLIACGNIVKDVQSFFWWEGKIDAAKESLVVMKAQRSKLPKLIKKIKSLHSYSVPEIIALPIIGGNADYLRWIDESS